MITIALDGPSGAGKSTVCDIVADRLGILHLNTGAIYRAIGLYVIQNKLDPNNQAIVEDALENIDIDIDFDKGEQNIILNGQNVTKDLYSLQVSDVTSLCSPYPKIREFIVKIQRAIADKYDCIMEGRDITSEVLPNAKFKFYLDASSQVRALRRINDPKNINKLSKDDFDKVKAEIELRDERDKNRKLSPLVIVKDAIYINSDNIDAYAVADIIVAEVDKRN